MAQRKPDELQMTAPYLTPENQQNINQAVQNAQNAMPMDWNSQVQSLYNQITNRPGFSYNPATDPLYHSVRDQFVQAGQRAMQDTLGQAAALTGGYNSSYAQSAGQQQYNDQMTKLSAQIPALMQQARAAYDKDTDDLYNRFGLAMQGANQQYQRDRDAIADQRYDAEWAQQMQAYQDDQNYRNWQMQQEEQDRAYQMVMQMVATGQVPPAELLASAGVSADYAKSMANYYGRQAALAAGGGSGRSGGSSGGRWSSGGSGSNGGSDPYQFVVPDGTSTAQVNYNNARQALYRAAQNGYVNQANAIMNQADGVLSKKEMDELLLLYRMLFERDKNGKLKDKTTGKGGNTGNISPKPASYDAIM